MQLNFLGLKEKEKRQHIKVSTLSKQEKIKENLKEWNTIDDVELYENLYEIYTQLFLQTQKNKLECLNYYIDFEKDNDKSIEYTIMYAEIKNTWNLPLKERFEKHKDLLNRVLSNDNTLAYSNCNNIVDEEENGQLSIFA